MSEEILRALMQLFAIIARQDGATINNHEKYVRDFLASQLSMERVNEYLSLYTSYLEENKPTINAETRTSMKDSVRTLAICKKINKTLVQKQKLIVLFRLIEFFRTDSHKSVNRLQIVETVADVFKIEKSEFLEIRKFVLGSEKETGKNEFLIGDDSDPLMQSCKFSLTYHGYNGLLRFHFIKSVNMIVVRYHGQSDHYLNGIIIKPENIYIFPQGSTLRLPQTTIYYSNIIARFSESDETIPFSFNAHIVEHKFPNGKQALHELKIAEKGGNLIGIMGASGSGKTTLLTLLSGQDRPSLGNIKINEYDLYSNRSELKGIIGFVPQDDLLMEDLTVYENLYYNAKLCFSDLSDADTEAKITKTLSALGLDEIKDVRVGNALNKKISGGQRKRLNIALELIREPNILFLDEPTSGLSSRDSENVMDLLKELTIKGKLVFVVIHQPSSDIYKMFDKLLILDTGGYAAYYGNPIEGVMYFKKLTNQINCEVGECHSCGSVNPETIFNLIELKEIDEYGNYTDKRKITPVQYFKFYRDQILHKISSIDLKGTIQNKLSVPGVFVQSKYFFLRDLYSKFANKQYIAINMLEVPLLVTFLSLIIRYIDKTKDGYSYYSNSNIPAYIFMSVIASMLVGLTISAEEIYKDLKILKRERFLHLSRFAYLLSKVAILFSISCIHSILYVLIGHYILDIQFNYFNFFIMIFSVFCFANLLGLILSSSFNSPVTIYIIIPLIIIPQMLLGGAMFNFNKLNEYFGGGNRVPVISNFMISRWAYEGMVVDMYVNNDFEKDRFVYDKLDSKLNYKISYFIPKVEELLAAGDSAKEKGTDNSTLIKNELLKDLNEAKAMGYQASISDQSNSGLIKHLSSIKAFYIDKRNSLAGLKEKFLKDNEKELGGAEKVNELKLNHVNEKLDEICTASLEMDKIAVSDHGIEQIIDPVFKDPEASQRLTGLSTHFLSGAKYILNYRVSTFCYNLMIIWIFNIFLFIFLYRDSVKKLLQRFN